MVLAFEALQAEVANRLFTLSGAVVVEDVIVQRRKVLRDEGALAAFEIRLA